LVAEKPVKPLRILILGGTGFTGPFQVRYALSRGHMVTVFNRGKTHPGELPQGVEQLIGDRNGQLDALKNRQWDAAIDNPTTLPVWVRDAAQILKGNVERYIFISTISVYAGTNKGVDESAPLQKYERPNAFKETLEAMRASGYKTYGPLKGLSEKEAEKWFPKKTLIIRPGLIVGPGDETDRFTYWPVRIERGGEVLAPGRPERPIQFIDARDLADWCVRLSEEQRTGYFNAVGPQSLLTTRQFLEACRSAVGCNARFSWVSDEELTAAGAEAWMDLPLWIPENDEDSGGLFLGDNQKAIAAGLTYRPILDTIKETLEWDVREGGPPDSPIRVTPISRKREASILAGWRHRPAA